MSEESLKSAFGAIWWRFLEFEITRSRMMTEVAGNMSSALILQVVAYHNLTLVQSAVTVKLTVKSGPRGNWLIEQQVMIYLKNSPMLPFQT